MAETVVYEAHPAMFRAHPFWSALAVVLIAAFGVGIIVLLYWYIKTRATTLIVTEHELMYEKGILSKDRLSVNLRHVRSVYVAQSFVHRILGVGAVQVLTGDEPEFTVKDMPDPHAIREAISRGPGGAGRAGLTERSRGHERWGGGAVDRHGRCRVLFPRWDVRGPQPLRRRARSEARGGDRLRRLPRGDPGDSHRLRRRRRASPGSSSRYYCGAKVCAIGRWLGCAGVVAVWVVPLSISFW
jgi:membrane protein YdbS with pleckstrin-like domain